MQRWGRPGGKLFFLIFLFCQSVCAQSLVTDSVSTGSNQEITGQHLVQPGDTYYRLSKIYQVPVDSLISWNGASLPVGKTIRVRSQSLIEPAKASGATVKAQAPRLNSPAKAKAADSKNTATASEPPQPVSTTITHYDKEDHATSAMHKTTQRIMVVPFDPYLYFSDADEDISRQSKIPRPDVRYTFRSRLSALLTPNGFETINLLHGGTSRSADSLPAIYKALDYQYLPVTASKYNPLPPKQKTILSGPKAWFQKQKAKVGITTPQEATAATAADKYYGVTAKSSDFYTYYNNRYQLDYYLFINQFEIHTDYSNCLDRTTQDFIREFTVHYTLVDAQGNLIAGNKVKIPYVSNVNDLDKISRDNLGKIAQRILDDLPPAQIPNSEAAAADQN